MLTNIPYIIATQICFAVLWSFYSAVLRRSYTFAQNRLYLLSMTVAAFVLPLIQIPVFPAPEITHVATAITAGEATAAAIAEKPATGLTEICIWLYMAGLLTMLGIFTYNALRIYKIKKQAQLISRGEISIFNSKSISGSFTFMNSIFINTGDMDKEAMEQVLTHEMSHIKLGHGKDLVLSQILLIFFWWNPFVWLWMRSLKEVHEFQADEAVLKNCDNSELYISLLLKGIADIHPEFVSGFSYSLIKNRLTMITRQNKKRFAKFRILLSLPVLAGLLICFSFTEQTARTDSAIEQSTTTETIAASVAEINNISEINAANESKPQEQQEAPFLRVQQMPTFEGGDLQSFRNWAMQKLIYPENAKKNGIQGKVVASFIIEKDGSLSSIKIENDPDKLLADEIIRVLKQSPKWTPGTQRGEKVRVKYSMPFDFKVN